MISIGLCAWYTLLGPIYIISAIIQLKLIDASTSTAPITLFDIAIVVLVALINSIDNNEAEDVLGDHELGPVGHAQADAFDAESDDDESHRRALDMLMQHEQLLGSPCGEIDADADDDSNQHVYFY